MHLVLKSFCSMNQLFTLCIMFCFKKQSYCKLQFSSTKIFFLILSPLFINSQTFLTYLLYFSRFCRLVISCRIPWKFIRNNPDDKPTNCGKNVTFFSLVEVIDQTVHQIHSMAITATCQYIMWLWDNGDHAQ